MVPGAFLQEAASDQCDIWNMGTAHSLGLLREVEISLCSNVPNNSNSLIEAMEEQDLQSTQHMVLLPS